MRNDYLAKARNQSCVDHREPLAALPPQPRPQAGLSVAEYYRRKAERGERGLYDLH